MLTLVLLQSLFIENGSKSILIWYYGTELHLNFLCIKLVKQKRQDLTQGTYIHTWLTSDLQSSPLELANRDIQCDPTDSPIVCTH